MDGPTALALGTAIGPTIALIVSALITYFQGKRAAREALKADEARAQISHDAQEAAAKADMARAAASRAAAEASNAARELIEAARQQDIALARIENTTEKTHVIVNDANTKLLESLSVATEKIAKDNPSDTQARYDANAAADAVAAKKNGGH